MRPLSGLQAQSSGRAELHSPLLFGEQPRRFPGRSRLLARPAGSHGFDSLALAAREIFVKPGERHYRLGRRIERMLIATRRLQFALAVLQDVMGFEGIQKRGGDLRQNAERHCITDWILI